MKTPRSAKAEVRHFNAQYPVGTVCDYWTKDREGDPSGTARIRIKANFLEVRGIAVVWLEGVDYCIPLTQVRVNVWMSLSPALRRRLHPQCGCQAPGETPR